MGRSSLELARDGVTGVEVSTCVLGIPCSELLGSTCIYGVDLCPGIGLTVRIGMRLALRCEDTEAFSKMARKAGHE